jgi:very-short-patch-repair endonuclease
MRAVTALAERQHGAIAARQLAAIGVERWWFDGLVRRRALRRIGSGVYVVAGSADTWRRRLHVGLLELGDDAIVSHEAAAALHRLDRALVEPVEFTVPRTRRNARSTFSVHSTKYLGRHDVVHIDGMRVMSATRTVIDLARARVPERRIEAAIDSAVRLGLSSPVVLAARLDELRGRGRWGCRLLDHLLVDSGGHSMLERRFLQLVRRHGLPRPRTQVVHRAGTRTVARVDFLYEEYGIVVEVSGSHGHADPRSRSRDAQRRDELQDMGRRVYEYTWQHVTENERWVATTLARRLRAAGWSG